MWKLEIYPIIVPIGKSLNYIGGFMRNFAIKIFPLIILIVSEPLLY